MLHAAAARGRRLDAFVVRKEGKAHGLQRRIEGPDVAGRRVLAVEDTSTTGGSVLTAVEALREAGAEVVGVAVIVERGAAGTVRAEGLEYLAAYDLADLGLADGRRGPRCSRSSAWPWSGRGDRLAGEQKRRDRVLAYALGRAWLSRRRTALVTSACLRAGRQPARPDRAAGQGSRS